MTGTNYPYPPRFFILLVLILSSVQCLVARNEVGWNYINLPATGSVGQQIYFNASVTNRGDSTWTANHYLELRDRDGVHLNYIGLGNTNPGATHSAAFALKLPDVPGTYTYHFMALQHGTEYFGPSLARTIVVRRPPLPVTLVLGKSEINAGESARVVSETGPDESVVTHGVEARVLGGRWQTWGEWKGRGGESRVAVSKPTQSGIYEIRAYAMREGEESSYSPRVMLRVAAVAPVITQQPVGVVTTVGQSVTLAVTVSGSEPVFQWRKDGVELPGASNASLTFSPTHMAQNGSYSVVVANSAGVATSRAVDIVVTPASLPAVGVEAWHFPAGGTKRAVALTATQVGDVVSIQSRSNLTAGAGWRHNIRVRRPAITTATAMAPEDGSGLTNAAEAWNTDGWGNPHTDGGTYDARIAGSSAVDLGNREPFVHTLAAGQVGSTRAFDFVLDAPGTWLVRAEIVDANGQSLANSATTSVVVSPAALAGEPTDITYPYGRDDKFVGVFWNAGQAHRLWSSWRAEFQSAYPATWATNWKLMWQPSPYFRRAEGGWLRPDPVPESPWQAFWSAHQVYAMVPDGKGGSLLTHDLTSQTFAEKAALRLMDIGVDFVAVDYSNQFLEEREDVFPAVNNLAQAFQAVAARSQSGQRVRLSAVVPANIGAGDWSGNGGFGPVAIARFNAKLTTLYNRFARFESAWFHLEDDNGVRKPLLMLWVGASGEDEPDGKLAPKFLDQLKLADGRPMTDVFTIRWVGAYLSTNRRFVTGESYAVSTPGGTVTGNYANAKFWSYHEHFPSAATLMPGASGTAPAIEAITVQPLAAGHDRFGRAWDQNWPTWGMHYETPANNESVPLANYGKTWAETLTVARALNPKFLLTTWAEFGSENDEPRPELSVTIMDNNKFGTHFGDVLKQAVRLFKYRAPSGWIDTFSVSGSGIHWFSEIATSAMPALHRGQTLRLQGWVTPNVATTFAGGSVKIYADEVWLGNAGIGGAWNGATRWTFDLPATALGVGNHTVKVVLDDGAGGSALAGVQFGGGRPANALSLIVLE